MNNIYYNIKDNWYDELTNTNQSSNSLANPKEALERGNLFNNLYKPYHNMNYLNLSTSNKNQSILYNLLSYDFIINELNLYLDIYPNNKEILSLYNKYLNILKQLVYDYELIYGPLTITDIQNQNNWPWLNNWPWEVSK